MDNLEFNQHCQQLSPNQSLKIVLITGSSLTGFLLRYHRATNQEGCLELETRQGIRTLLSSSIESITPSAGFSA